MPNRYKIDYNTEYNRIEKPFGVYVWYRWRWKYICNFKTDDEAQAYIVRILKLPREIRLER